MVHYKPMISFCWRAGDVLILITKPYLLVFMLQGRCLTTRAMRDLIPSDSLNGRRLCTGKACIKRWKHLRELRSVCACAPCMWAGWGGGLARGSWDWSGSARGLHAESPGTRPEACSSRLGKLTLEVGHEIWWCSMFNIAP